MVALYIVAMLWKQSKNSSVDEEKGNSSLQSQSIFIDPYKRKESCLYDIVDELRQHNVKGNNPVTKEKILDDFTYVVYLKLSNSSSRK